MARRSSKNQARRNGGSGIPGWIWLLVGLLGGLVIAAVLFLRGQWRDVDSLLPQPNPEARAPSASEQPVAQDAPEPKKPKYDFYDVLRDKEVIIPDAELSAQARAEADAPSETPAPEATDGPRYLIQAGAFRSSADAEALKARIALTGEVARVESAEIQGGTIYRVRLGPYPNASTLAAAKQALGNHGIEAVAIRAQ
ncbi:SPOR domain-containing protein [Arenimonas daejeonensis]|uniref:SPOR domain-containing protein n=1 Tax=Arenimonas daejeonensis TaxID=370777 RepID=UPI0011BF8305|nr:SPOR domain-containing protein [Arenimonas daejeonensis]